MRPIKFRGRDVHTGEYVYAELGQISEEINPGYLSFITDDDMYTVETDSIAQLVGYDANGNEIYEGDTVIRYDSEEEFIEAPENGVLREVVLYTQVYPDLEAYYCLVKEDD